jgi:hypothetical protein
MQEVVAAGERRAELLEGIAHKPMLQPLCNRINDIVDPLTTRKLRTSTASRQANYPSAFGIVSRSARLAVKPLRRDTTVLGLDCVARARTNRVRGGSGNHGRFGSPEIIADAMSGEGAVSRSSSTAT